MLAKTVKWAPRNRRSLHRRFNQAKSEDMLVYGPFPADGFFGSHSRSQFDAVLAMYHDQGLAAFKALAFDDGVNFTAGLPIVRTSPDHGTAFDIAGKNEANELSMRSAIYLSMDIYRTRKFLKEINANPLQPQPQGSGKKQRNEAMSRSPSPFEGIEGRILAIPDLVTTISNHRIYNRCLGSISTPPDWFHRQLPTVSGWYQLHTVYFYLLASFHKSGNLY